MNQNPYKNYILYRFIEDHGWYITGRQTAASNHAQFYVKEFGMSCRRRHLAPIYVENNRCSKCVELGHHDVPQGDELTIDVEPGQPIDKIRIEEFWRHRLDLPDYDNSLTHRQHHSVYVIDNEPFFSKRDMMKDIPVTYATIIYRCKSTSYEFMNYVRILVPGVPSEYVYVVNGKMYSKQKDIAEDLGLTQPIVSLRISSPEWTTWEKLLK